MQRAIVITDFSATIWSHGGAWRGLSGLVMATSKKKRIEFLDVNGCYKFGNETQRWGGVGGGPLRRNGFRSRKMTITMHRTDQGRLGNPGKQPSNQRQSGRQSGRVVARRAMSERQEASKQEKGN
jgi:hypothetical protein